MKKQIKGCNLRDLEATLLEFAKFNATPEEGITRFSYSPQDKAAKNYLIAELESLGMEVEVDPVGNLKATLAGSEKNLPAIWVGSHLDTVLHGGKFDGIVGVVAALEVCRVIQRQNIAHKNPIVLVVYAEEEGSNFDCTTFGSKCMLGKLTEEDLYRLKNARGVSAFEVIRDAGYQPEQLNATRVNPSDIKAVLECHVEQSIMLDQQKIPIGIVGAIIGMRTLKITAEGEANHAGSTPMGMRKDALVTAAGLVQEVRHIADNAASKTSVATVGTLQCYPGVANIIPGKVEMTVDIRDVTQQGIDAMYEKLSLHVEELNRSGPVHLRQSTLALSSPVKMSPKVVEIIQTVADELGYSYTKTNSGATHDVAIMAELASAALIFVPSKNGISHSPQEDTAYEHIAMGANLLLNTVIRLSQGGDLG